MKGEAQQLDAIRIPAIGLAPQDSFNCGLLLTQQRILLALPQCFTIYRK